MKTCYEGLNEIGNVVGRSPRTVQRWIKIHGFPACKLPNGNWFTTDSLIDTWILARHELMAEKGMI